MIPTPTPTPGTEPTLDAMYRAVIGPKHTDIYLRYFAKRDAGGGFVSWNWPALFVQFFWSLYRKMWGFAFGGLALQIAGSVILTIVFGVLAAMLMPSAASAYMDNTARSMGLNASVFPAMLANGFYHRKVRRLIKETAHITDPDARLQQLARRGGTSSGWLWLFPGIIVSGIAAYIGFRY